MVFLRVQPAKIDRFQKDAISGGVNLADYGEVLRRGWGERPPEDVLVEMREKYGYRAG